MTPFIKGAIAAGTLASIGGATYAGIHYLSPSLQISKLIDQEYKHLLLDTAEGKDAEYWKTNWNSYKEHKGNLFNLTGWKADDSALDLTKELKKKCSELKISYVYSSNDELYQNVTKYCGRWVTVKDEAIKKGLKILDTTGATSTNEWGQKNTGKANLQAHIKKLEIVYESASPETIKQGCEKAKTKDKKLDNYSDIYASYVAVCTNPS